MKTFDIKKIQNNEIYKSKILIISNNQNFKFKKFQNSKTFKFLNFEIFKFQNFKIDKFKS